ncbi:inositol monophosphatase family protein [Paenibacillus radicis (ex Gao et al. 2016)]|uniref:Inositol-1-monophosphatase n=1 Tax=Paenibacillus radicis (ex Gao et al. 2016) TaxID=1737354 RepID=A0A917H850_9BACL|nr:inositol monophosphatase family protein [Paenibacillus radicis (ex Gao et al. 2016)]GGG70587.1 inositol monophosphatase [Paenibacillus radicis (ex Gao et al. 2016)]
MKNLETVWIEMEKITRDAGKWLQNGVEASTIRQKGDVDYVTEVDLQVQTVICEQLSERFPLIQFMGEEKDNSELDLDGTVWILDPVDGTANLIHDTRMSVISLALVKNREVLAGVIYQPYTDELFSAAKGKGAFLNGSKIHVSNVDSLKGSLVAIGTSPYYHEYADWVFNVSKKVFLSCQDIRRSGSAAMDLAYIAAGRMDGMFERVLQPWDIAAGKILIEEAGGKMTDLQGNEMNIVEKGSVLASNGWVHNELQLLMESN